MVFKSNSSNVEEKVRENLKYKWVWLGTEPSDCYPNATHACASWKLVDHSNGEWLAKIQFRISGDGKFTHDSPFWLWVVSKWGDSPRFCSTLEKAIEKAESEVNDILEEPWRSLENYKIPRSWDYKDNVIPVYAVMND